MKSVEVEIKQLVLGIHQRNGGGLVDFDLGMPLMAPSLLIDSLDLAEIMVAIERKYGVSPFNDPLVGRGVPTGAIESSKNAQRLPGTGRPTPRTWLDIVEVIEASHGA